MLLFSVEMNYDESEIENNLLWVEKGFIDITFVISAIHVYCSMY
jgi:hypothetical protein